MPRHFAERRGHTTRGTVRNGLFSEASRTGISRGHALRFGMPYAPAYEADFPLWRHITLISMAMPTQSPNTPKARLSMSAGSFDQWASFAPTTAMSMLGIINPTVPGRYT